MAASCPLDNFLRDTNDKQDVQKGDIRVQLMKNPNTVIEPQPSSILQAYIVKSLRKFQKQGVSEPLT